MFYFSESRGCKNLVLNSSKSEPEKKERQLNKNQIRAVEKRKEMFSIFRSQAFHFCFKFCVK